MRTAVTAVLVPMPSLGQVNHHLAKMTLFGVGSIKKLT
jgi:hypothetical protein